MPLNNQQHYQQPATTTPATKGNNTSNTHPNKRVCGVGGEYGFGLNTSIGKSNDLFAFLLFPAVAVAAASAVAEIVTK